MKLQKNKNMNRNNHNMINKKIIFNYLNSRSKKKNNYYRKEKNKCRINIR